MERKERMQTRTGTFFSSPLIPVTTPSTPERRINSRHSYDESIDVTYLEDNNIILKPGFPLQIQPSHRSRQEEREPPKTTANAQIKEKSFPATCTPSRLSLDSSMTPHFSLSTNKRQRQRHRQGQGQSQSQGDGDTATTPEYEQQHIITPETGIGTGTATDDENENKISPKFSFKRNPPFSSLFTPIPATSATTATATGTATSGVAMTPTTDNQYLPISAQTPSTANSNSSVNVYLKGKSLEELEQIVQVLKNKTQTRKQRSRNTQVNYNLNHNHSSPRADPEDYKNARTQAHAMEALLRRSLSHSHLLTRTPSPGHGHGDGHVQVPGAYKMLANGPKQSNANEDKDEVVADTEDEVDENGQENFESLVKETRAHVLERKLKSILKPPNLNMRPRSRSSGCCRVSFGKPLKPVLFDLKSNAKLQCCFEAPTRRLPTPWFERPQTPLQKIYGSVVKSMPTETDAQRQKLIHQAVDNGRMYKRIKKAQSIYQRKDQLTSFKKHEAFIRFKGPVANVETLSLFNSNPFNSLRRPGCADAQAMERYGDCFCLKARTPATRDQNADDYYDLKSICDSRNSTSSATISNTPDSALSLALQNKTDSS